MLRLMVCVSRSWYISRHDSSSRWRRSCFSSSLATPTSVRASPVVRADCGGVRCRRTSISWEPRNTISIRKPAQNESCNRSVPERKNTFCCLHLISTKTKIKNTWRFARILNKFILSLGKIDDFSTTKAASTLKFLKECHNC